METTDQEIKTYIKKALEHQDFVKCDVALTGSSQNSDGYASNITFATVLVTTAENVDNIIEVAAKSGRKNIIQSNRHLFRREAYFYETILPQFTNFQIQNNIKNVFSSVPKCYKYISDETVDFIVMENLRKSGYILYDRKKPLDINHLKLILREYGKFHAISFALREKNIYDFQKLVTNFDEIMIHFFVESFRKIMNKCVERAGNIMKEIGEVRLYEMCYKILQKGADVAMIEILETKEPKSAILHGDCWSSNFMYKYEDSSVPSKVAILDWQLCRLNSPVLDLSNLIYSTCSEEELKHFEELLKTYYASFSKFSKDLGCDPEKLFPYTTLQSHWKKYSLYGVLMLTTFLNLTLCENEEVPDLNQCKDATDFTDKLMNIKITNESEYRKRIIAVITHYSSCIDS